MIKTILVPISGSDTDTRVFSAALSVARPLAAHLRFFHVRLSACEAAIRTRHVEPHSAPPRDLDSVAAQLSWHGIFAEVRHLTGTPKSASQVLLQSAADLNPEILVVGGYSHRPLQEMIFGGVTRAFLAQAETPIFMMH